MESTHESGARTRLGAMIVLVGTGLYVAAISSGVVIALNALRALMAVPCGLWPSPCLLHP
jgi:hypothetical protein